MTVDKDQKGSDEFFYVNDEGMRCDADIHEPILANVDSYSERIAMRERALQMGIEPSIVDSLYPMPDGPDPDIDE